MSMRKGVVERATVLVGEWSRETAYCTIKRCCDGGVYTKGQEREERERG